MATKKTASGRRTSTNKKGQPSNGQQEKRKRITCPDDVFVKAVKNNVVDGYVNTAGVVEELKEAGYNMASGSVSAKIGRMRKDVVAAGGEFPEAKRGARKKSEEEKREAALRLWESV